MKPTPAATPPLSLTDLVTDPMGAPAAGVVALFVSDIHLQPDMPATTAAFLDFLQQHALRARQLYLLGDIFDYWAGDDDLASPFPQRISQALRQVSDAGVAVFWIAGNRDFLVGNSFALATGATLLEDPSPFEFRNQRYLLSHGDQLCRDDIAYQQFRAMVRQPKWQTEFLARPLAERKGIISAMRMQSQQHQKEHIQNRAEAIMDVHPQAVTELFASTASTTIIHGHTHRPATHQEGHLRRFVLPDWDCDHQPARGGWLALHEDGSLLRHTAAGVLCLN